MSLSDWAKTVAVFGVRVLLSTLHPAIPIAIGAAETAKSFYDGDYSGAAIDATFTIADIVTFGMASTAAQASKESGKRAIIQTGKEQAKAAEKVAIKTAIKAGPSEALKDTVKSAASQATKQIRKEQGQRIAKQIAENGLKGAAKKVVVEEGKQATKKLAKEATKKIGKNLGKEFAEKAARKASKEARKKVGKLIGASMKNLLQDTMEETWKKGTKFTAASVGKEALMGAGSLTGARKAVFQHLMEVWTENLIQKALPKTAKAVFDPQLQKAATRAFSEEFTKFSNKKLVVDIARTGVSGATNLYNGVGRVL